MFKLLYRLWCWLLGVCFGTGDDYVPAEPVRSLDDQAAVFVRLVTETGDRMLKLNEKEAALVAKEFRQAHPELHPTLKSYVAARRVAQTAASNLDQQISQTQGLKTVGLDYNDAVRRATVEQASLAESQGNAVEVKTEDHNPQTLWVLGEGCPTVTVDQPVGEQGGLDCGLNGLPEVLGGLTAKSLLLSSYQQVMENLRQQTAESKARIAEATAKAERESEAFRDVTRALSTEDLRALAGLLPTVQAR